VCWVNDPQKIKCYMKMAEEISYLSPDEETQVGALLVSSEGRIIASSFNGFLRGAPDDELPTTRPEKYQYMQHAERNLLYNCGYEGIRTKDTTIICTLSPCLECLRASFASGVKAIIFKDLYAKFDDINFYKKLPDVHVDISTIAGHAILNMKSIKEYRGSGESARFLAMQEMIEENDD